LDVKKEVTELTEIDDLIKEGRKRHDRKEFTIDNETMEDTDCRKKS